MIPPPSSAEKGALRPPAGGRPSGLPLAVFADAMNWAIVSLTEVGSPLPGPHTAIRLSDDRPDTTGRRLPLHVFVVSDAISNTGKTALDAVKAPDRVLVLHVDGIEAALDAAARLGVDRHPNLFVGGLQDGTVIASRVDTDGLSPVEHVPGVTRHAMARDFAQLLAARRMMRRSASPSTDHGRSAASSWIRSLGVRPHHAVVTADVAPEVRRFSPSRTRTAPTIYIHGGGLVHYDLDLFSPFLSHLAECLNATIFAVGYQKCPEMDAGLVVEDLIGRVAALTLEHRVDRIMGDSLGGLLALYAAARALPRRFKEAILFYPVLSLRRTFPSYEVYGEGYLLDQGDMRWFRSLVAARFLEERFDPVDGLSGELAGIRITVVSAGCDVLADEASLFCRTSGARLIRHDALPHDFCLYAQRLEPATAAIAALADSLTEEASHATRS